MALTPSIIFISLTGIILLLIGIVAILERFVSRNKKAALETPEYEFTAELQTIKKSNFEPQELLNRIDSLARKALVHTITPLNSAGTVAPVVHAGHLDYSQIAETHKDKPHVVQFCSAMMQSLYTGEKITPLQTKNLLHSLEDMLKGEGKLVLIEPKKEILEEKQGFFLDKIIEDLAQKLQERMQNAKERKEAEEKEAITKELEEKKEIAKEKEELEQPQEFKKTRLPVKAEMKKKDRKEYHYIESIDVLDRIEKKLSGKKAAA